MKNVIFYLIKSGNHEYVGETEAVLTQVGEIRVGLSALEHLDEVAINFAFHSGKEWAIQTLKRALTVLDQNITYQRMVEFDDYKIPEDQLDLYDEYVKKLSLDKQGLHNPQELLDVWNYGNIVRFNIQKTLTDLASSLSKQESSRKVINVLVVSHSPLIELSAADPAAIPFLRSADMLKHRIEVDDEGTVLVSSVYLPCPKVG